MANSSKVKIAIGKYVIDFILDEITELKVDFVVRTDFEIGWDKKLTAIRTLADDGQFYG